MLHLLPIRLVLWLFALLIATAIVAAFYIGWLGQGDVLQQAARVIRWSSTLAIAAIVVLHTAWRWLPGVQLTLFPYLGGRWRGVVRFQGQTSLEHREVDLQIKHTLFGLKLLLESEESISWILVVHAEKHPDFAHFRLYYVYLNERKEGIVGASARYRGVAVIRVHWDSQPELHGDCFTETNRKGTLQLKRAEATPWWKLWR